HRLRVVIQSHAGQEGPVFTIALTRDAFTISAGFLPEDSLATLILVGSSANRNKRGINSPSSVVHRRALSPPRSSSKVPARGGDSFARGGSAARGSPWGSRCFDRSGRGRGSRLDF